MMLRELISFSTNNRRLLALLIAGWLLWSGALAGLWLISQQLPALSFWWSAGFIFVQLYLAVQVLLPALLLEPEQRTRGFYLFWLLGLGGVIWLVNLLPAWLLTSALSSSLLMFTGTLIGIVLARYVKRLWDLLPLCLVLIMADLSSWAVGPTAEFARAIEDYYQDPVGSAPLIDMVLVKLSYPGAPGLVPVFGVSDWIMVVFFAALARRFRINDNLLGVPPLTQYPERLCGRYLPVSVVALFAAIMLAHAGGSFVPALPLIVLVVVLYTGLSLLVRRMRGLKN